MNRITIKPELLHVLCHLSVESFTVADLTKAYLGDPDSRHKNKKPARQFIYRNMIRMIKAGLMERINVDGGWPHYSLTKQFHKCYQATATKNKTLDLKQGLSPPQKLKNETITVINPLKERLGKHRTDMLCALGEAEEYNELCSEFPNLSSETQVLYNEARERSTMLLGKIKALESLLCQQMR